MKKFTKQMLSLGLLATAMIMGSCSNESIVTSEESTTTTILYEPKTEAGKTYSQFTNLMTATVKTGIETVEKYIDITSVSRSGNIQDIEDIGKLLPNDLSILKRTVVTGRSDEKEITLDEELENIVAEFSAKIEQIKPDPSDAQSLAYCDATTDGVIIGDDIIIKNDNMIGLSHEHQRWDRDEYVEFDDINYIIDKDNSNYTKKSKEQSGWRWENRWYKILWWKVRIPTWVYFTTAYSITSGEYDYLSIMHYDAIFKATKNRQGYSAGENIYRGNTLSTLDKDAVKRMY